MGTGAEVLLGPAQIRELAARLDLRPTKTLGQNFVHDPNTIRRIVREAALMPGEAVLEIGPGLGSLTLGLLSAGHPVTAVEIDPRLAEELPRTVAALAPALGAGLSVITADALSIQELPGPAPTALVANLPYNISVPVLLHLLASFPSIGKGLILVQLEVADRLVAAPGSKIYGIPSAKLAWYATARRVAVVPRNVFWPVPNVESGLVSFLVRPREVGRLEVGRPEVQRPEVQPAEVGRPEVARPEVQPPEVQPAEVGRSGVGRLEVDRLEVQPPEVQPSEVGRPEVARPEVDRREVFAVIDAAFSQRRKMLRSVLASWAGSPAAAVEILQRAGVDPTARGETLDIEAFSRIAASRHNPRVD